MTIGGNCTEILKAQGPLSNLTVAGTVYPGPPDPIRFLLCRYGPNYMQPPPVNSFDCWFHWSIWSFLKCASTAKCPMG